jgi:beta-alanine--pyruvate transaminase
LLAGVDHLPHTHLPENAWTRGQPEHGAHLADELERIVALHGAETVAAVIVEPMAGSTGVLLPPKGYLERLREICTKHGILLIFDEVITGFGRLGSSFAAEHFGVQPDMITLAKGLTNGVIPMGAVLCHRRYSRRLHAGPRASDRALSRLHLFGQPDRLGRRARHARDLSRGRAVRARRRTGPLLGGGAARPQGHAPRDRHPQHGADRRDRARADCRSQPTKRAFSAFLKAYEKGVLIRTTGDIIAMSPPLIIEKAHIDQIVAR